MKGVEKRLLHGVGIKGFSALKRKASAQNEEQRTLVMTKMFLGERMKEHDEEAKQLQYKQDQIDRETVTPELATTKSYKNN